MKSSLKIVFLFFVIQSGMWVMPEKSSAQVSVSFQIFYDDLSPYGNWIQNPEYGYVWIPNVDPGFAPYGSNGYWVYTDFGWTWVSNYPWGWAPFHYGRWYSDPVYGPIWVPGTEWGPGWVTWRRSEGYYGWAPIGPGISINIAYSNSYNVPRDQWRFVRDRDFGRRDIHNHYVNSSNTTTIINNSTVINNTYIDNSNHVRYNTGPERAEVQKRTGGKINAVPLKEYNKPGQQMSKGELQMYRPRIENNGSASKRPAPSRVYDLKEVKPVKERHSDVQSPKQSKPGKAQPAQQPRHDQSTIHQQPKNQQKDNRPVQQPKRVQPTQPQNKPNLNQPAVQPRRDQQKQHAKPQPNQPSTQPGQEQQRTAPHPQIKPPVGHTPSPQKPKNVKPENHQPPQKDNGKRPK